jgi:PHD/YefM family antitoxin component YafN of YafNO toxin-antitoxin module
MSIRAVSTTRLRGELASTIEALSEVSAIIVTLHGHGRAVMMDLDRYNRLVDRIEYLEDSIAAIEAPREGAVPLDELDPD